MIALSAIPELSHLARAWAHALMAVVLVPLGWTMLFATAGALTSGRDQLHRRRGGLAGHVAAAFAGLITFVIAVKLPLMLLGELRHLFGGCSFAEAAAQAAHRVRARCRARERMRAAHARLRSVAL